CPACPMAFSSQEELLGHQSRHGVAGPPRCPTCGKAFKNGSGLARHRHGTQRSFKCGFCPKAL
ncbi:ZFP11 protein, partial [Aegotheles bennettii]|nr:ZFP11 protein [Aegotheles bennettii]